MQRSLTLLTTGLITIELFCPPAAHAQAWVGWDHLDVEVVESGPLADSPETWTLDGPTLTIGTIDGAEPFIFTHVWDADRTADGRVIVVDGSAYYIRVFGASGEHVVTFGGRGAGPEEFGGSPFIALDDDLLVVWDPGHHRLSNYSLGGELLAQETLRDHVFAQGITPFPNGTVWETSASGLLWTGADGRIRPREGLSSQFRRFIWLDADASNDFGTFRSGQLYSMSHPQGGLRGFASPFAPSSVAALSDDGRVAVSEGDDARILIYDPAKRPVRLIIAQIPRLPTTRPIVRTHRDRLLGMSSGLGVPRRQLEEAFDELPVPDSIPAIADLLWSEEGDLWVGRRAGDIWAVDEYHVFGTDGEWLARVPLPSRVDKVFHVGAGVVLARHRDDFGVQYLDLYSIDRDPRPPPSTSPR